MDVVDAARDVTRALAVRLESGSALEAVAAGGDGDPAGWLAGRSAEQPDTAIAEALRLLAAQPADAERATAVVGRLVMKAAADPDFAEELVSRARLSAAAGAQQARVDSGGVAMNSGGAMDVSDARITGGGDNSGQSFTIGPDGTLIHSPVVTATGAKAKIFVGGKLSKRKIFLLPFGFFIRVGRKAGTAAAAHPAAAAAACTVIVVGGATGAIALAQAPASLSTSPTSFSGFWQGTITEAGRPAGYSADVAITGGPLNGTVGSVNLTSQHCTSALTLTEAHEQDLKITDDVTLGSCAGGTLVLKPEGDELRYTLTHADGTTATGLLKRVQSFAAPAPTATAPQLPKPLQIVNSNQPVVPLPSNAKGYTLPDIQYPTVVPGTLPADAAKKLDIALQQPIQDWAAAVFTDAATSSAETFPSGALGPTEQSTETSAGQLVSVFYRYQASDDLGGDGGQIVLVRGDTDAVVPVPDILTPAAKEAPGLQRIATAINGALSEAEPGCQPLTGDDLAKDLLTVSTGLAKSTDATIGVETSGLDFMVEPGRQDCGLIGSGPARTVLVPFTQLSGLVNPDIIALAGAKAAPAAPASSAPSAAATTSAQANGPDCGLPTQDLGGDHLIVLNGSMTCAQAQKILTDYLNDHSNWQGSGGFDTVDGMQCGHNSIAGRDSSGIWASCGTSDTAAFETKRP